MDRHLKYPRLLGISIFLWVTLAAGIIFAAGYRQSFGAQGADILRQVFGDRAVARLEMIVFHLQDRILRWGYQAGLVEPACPWEIASMPVPTKSPLMPGVIVQSSATPMPMLTRNTSVEQRSDTPTPAPTALPTCTPSPTPWMPVAIQSLGSLEGEGVWMPYIQNIDGDYVAYRAFLQPDQERPYVIVAIVAFDLNKTRLHFVLGSEEPYNPDSPKRDGRIPGDDNKPDRLLATFNGGFKATHGQFGAMAGGIEALPPRDGFGTVAMYSGGRVSIGVWGEEILPTVDLIAWRQNGPFVIDDGQINEEIYNNNPMDWGFTVDDVSPTLRSGLAISDESETLYYLAGDKMTMEDLAISMQAIRAKNGIQLDINNYWVNFVVHRAQAESMISEPLLPDLMRENLDRYLYPYVRDFFYITYTP